MCVFFILVSKGWVDHLGCLSCDIWYTSNITNITLNRFGILERMVSGIVQQVGRYRTIYSKIIRYLLDATRYLVFFFWVPISNQTWGPGIESFHVLSPRNRELFQKKIFYQLPRWLHHCWSQHEILCSAA